MSQVLTLKNVAKLNIRHVFREWHSHMQCTPIFIWEAVKLAIEICCSYNSYLARVAYYRMVPIIKRINLQNKCVNMQV